MNHSCGSYLHAPSVRCGDEAASRYIKNMLKRMKLTKQSSEEEVAATCDEAEEEPEEYVKTSRMSLRSTPQGLRYALEIYMPSVRLTEASAKPNAAVNLRQKKRFAELVARATQKANPSTQKRHSWHCMPNYNI